MKIYVGADHRGFSLKERTKDYLLQNGYDVEDLGNTVLDPEDDFPIFAHKVAEAVVADTQSRGIIFCGSGAGVDIAANKVSGARSGLALSAEQIMAARRDDNINILTLAADYLDTDTVNAVVDAFLTTEYENTEKHERRLNELEHTT